MAVDKKMLKVIPVSKFDIGITALTNLKLIYFINAYVRNKILILDIYDTENNLKYRVFQSKTEFVTLEGTKWRQSMLSNLFESYPYPTFIALKKSTAVIQKYLKTEEDAIKAIKSLQDGIRKNELDNRHKSELDLIDDYMKPIKAVPKDFDKWLNDVALIDSRYIIYEYKACKTMKGRCTHCNADVMIEKPKHNEPGICPNCKSKIIYKAKGKANNIIDHCTAQLLQKHPLGIVVREFNVIKKYDRNGKSDFSYWEKNRSITGKENKDFAWDEYKQSGTLRWCKDKYWYIDTGALYTRNLKRELGETEFKYSGLPEMMLSGRITSATDYLRAYQNGPALEYLSKLKLYNLVYSVLFNRYFTGSIDLEGKNPLEVLKLSKDGLKKVIKLDASLNELKLLQISEKEGVHIPDELFEEIAEDFGYYYEDFIRISKLSNLYQQLKYIKSKKINYGDYRDYINMAIKLNWDVKDRFILFPRNFKKAHDQVQELVRVKEIYEDNKIIQEMYQKLSKQMNFSKSGYLIRLPMSAKEIIKEGHTLHHCVGKGDYIKSMANGKTLILFIRKQNNPYEPFFTLELNPKDYRVTQVRGVRNCGPDESINKFIDGFKQNLNRIKVDIAC